MFFGDRLVASNAVGPAGGRPPAAGRARGGSRRRRRLHGRSRGPATIGLEVRGRKIQGGTGPWLENRTNVVAECATEIPSFAVFKVRGRQQTTKGIPRL